MFTGIIESRGKLQRISPSGGNLTFLVESTLAEELKPGDSVSHNGVCLTVETLPSSNQYTVSAIQETLGKTNLGDLKEGDFINLERSLRGDGRIDGHFVQGHVDAIGEILEVTELSGSHEFWISYPPEERDLLVPRGSIALDGISLTVAELEDHRFKVAIIPHTLQHTNLQQRKTGDRINLEFDVLGKYIRRMAQNRS
ncbi:MAG: riboflavin synthase [Spirochaetaceae bacterium]|nr:riboflavin synthase [Spirochaetaceae bacterium]|tara:strand:+ start:254198 stop:254791 length:594 start_codon:yes stop_codon:yes gene_type:complete